MEEIKKILLTYLSILSIVPKKKRVLFFLFLFTSVFSGILELLSITSIMPLIDLAVGNKRIFFLDQITNFFEFGNFFKGNLLIFFILSFIIIIIISTIFRFLLFYLSAHISYGVIFDINQLIVRKIIYRDTLENKNININSAIATLSKVDEIATLITHVLNFFSSIIISFIIACVLFYINTVAALISLVIFLLYYGVIIFFSKSILFTSGNLLSININAKTQAIVNLIGFMRNIIIDKMHNFFIKSFSKSDYRISRIRTLLSMISIAPGLFLISFFSILSALLILYFNLYNINLLENTPIIAAFAFGSQKLIPLLQNIFNAISRSRSSYFVAKDILFFLKKKSHKSAFSENIKHDKVLLNFKEFKKKLTLKNIYFKHSDQKDFILKGINIVINKGEKILIRGDSGSGKSTLIDIISGIVFPNKGKIIMDGININRKNLEVLHRQIAYVPQNIFISEDTFLNNIVVGKNKDEINFGDIKKASKIAEIYEFIVKKDLGFNAVVNHEGLNLSGGQRQRIGIARAIYKNSPILILDESTNALNSRIEKKIIQNIFKLGKNKTIIIVSHKDLKKFKFDKVYSLN